MHLSSLLDIAADALADRVAVAACAGAPPAAPVAGPISPTPSCPSGSHAVARHLAAAGAERLVAVDVNSEAVPIGLFGAARANIPYVPVNYRLADAQLRAILERAAPGLAVVEASVPPRLGGDIAGLSLDLAGRVLGGRRSRRSRWATATPRTRPCCSSPAGRRGSPRPPCCVIAT